MNEMNSNNRGDYDDRDYRNYRDYRDYRDYNYRGDGDYRGDYRENYRDDYDYRGYDDRDYNERKRDYDRRGGKINYRNYRNYRNQDYHEELDMVVYDMKEQTRKLEDIAEMAENPQDKNILTKIAQKEKENYMYLKQLSEK